MDADGLPLVGPGVDYTKVECINQKRMVAFLNHFVSHTAGFLNRFSCVCEEKLEHLSHRMQQLEITMSLLEAKISSIPGLENVTAASSSTSGPTPTTSDGAGATAPPPAPSVPTSAEPPAEQPTGDNAPPPPQPEPVASNPVSQDPRFVKYFKMVKMGVPESAVKMKMSAEGLNPDLLDDPDAPAPAGGADNNDDDDDFSDSSDNQSDDSDDFD
ncbi:WASH complex subunit 3-like [Ruditapes philippinarum]|uniref:WASH complex subunit 3-like n=1 Tax=Ruditapes philippinarum TaxID=129788 RepID=UPI00295B2F35|nr:WASH complex subunit 3-like [Ruditapes philippinarum]